MVSRHNLSACLGLILSSAVLIGGTGLAQGPGPGPRGFGGGFGGGFGPGMGRVVTGEPYTASATSTSLEKLANGTTISHSSTITEARDSQGRTYRSVTTPGGSTGQAFTRTTVFDPVAHTMTEWGTQSTTATQFQMPDRQHGDHAAWAGGANGAKPNGAGPGGPGGGGRFNGQMARTTLAAQSIAGVNAEGVRTTMTIPAGAQGNDKALVSTHEVWRSTDLKIVLQETSDDPRRGTQSMQVTKLTPGEPNPAMFEIPQGYTVKTETRHRGN